jgi:peptidoglycan hydrolase-like protein with peptidoglycan-binding domain
MSPNVFNESVQNKGPYSKPEIQKLQQQLEKMPLEEIRKQLDELSAEVENKLKYANMGSLDAKYKKFLNVRENLTLIDGLYDKLSPEQQQHVDNYQQGGSERSIAVTQAALLQLGLLWQDTVLGIFDKDTLYSVIAFQKMSKDYKGQQDGLIGKQTLTALQAGLEANNNIVAPVLSNTVTTKPELEQVQDDIQDLQKQVEVVSQNPVATQEDNSSVPFAQANESVVLTKPDVVVENTATPEVAPTPTIEDAKNYVEAVTNIVENPTKIETIPAQNIATPEVTRDIVTPSNSNVDVVVSVPEPKKETITNPITSPSPETTNTESRHPTFNTLDDYIITYMDEHWYDIAKISKEDLPKEIKKHTKEALVANPSILRYGMVLRAQDTQGNYYIGTLVEDPSKKDFTKSNVLRVNRPWKNNAIENIAFPLENIVAVLPNEKKLFSPDQQQEFDKLEAKYKREQEKIKKEQEKIKKKESKKENSEK